MENKPEERNINKFSIGRKKMKFPEIHDHNESESKKKHKFLKSIKKKYNSVDANINSFCDIVVNFFHLLFIHNFLLLFIMYNIFNFLS